MLTPAERSSFEEEGFVRIPGIFPRAAAAEMEELVWQRLHQNFGTCREDPSTWAIPFATGLQPLKRHRVFEPIDSERLHGALDDLMGEGRWQKPSHWGQFLVTFPTSPAPQTPPTPGSVRSDAETDARTDTWTVPRGGWHTDYPYTMPQQRLHGALVFSLLSDVPAGHGGTMVVAGSPRVVDAFVSSQPAKKLVPMKAGRLRLFASNPWLSALVSDDDDPERIERFMGTGGKIGDVSVRVVELTGNAGDVILAHPWLLHAPSANCGTHPRIMRVQRLGPRRR